MKKPELDLKTKVSFNSLEKLVNYCLKFDITLGYIELDYIFKHVVYKKNSNKFFNPNYKKLYNAVKYLLENLNDKQQELLIALINNDFEFTIEYYINSNILDDNFLGDEFAGYSYTCTNPQTSTFLIQLAQQMQTKVQNSSLENFKNSL